MDPSRRGFLGLLLAAGAAEVGRRYFDLGPSWQKHASGLLVGDYGLTTTVGPLYDGRLRQVIIETLPMPGDFVYYDPSLVTRVSRERGRGWEREVTFVPVAAIERITPGSGLPMARPVGVYLGVDRVLTKGRAYTHYLGGSVTLT